MATVTATRTPTPHTAQATTGHRHAGLGIASFIIGVIALLMICGGFGGVFIIILRDPALVQAAQSIKPGDTTIPPAVVPLIIANCVMLSGMGVALIGVVLGATSFAIPNRKPLWPILGTCLNAVILLATTFILLLGFVAG